MARLADRGLLPCLARLDTPAGKAVETLAALLAPDQRDMLIL
jgi:hypothetical protein